MRDVLRAEAAIEPDPVPTGRADQGNADHRDLRQGRHRQELHARQPLLHDGAAGQEGAADRLRPEERHHLAAVRRPRLPDHHRNLVARRSSPAKRSRSATSASSATASSRWSSAGPKSAAAAAGAASSTASSCSRSSASTTGASTTCCSTSWATWSAAASACRSRATCARRSSSSARNDLQSLYVANNVCSAVEYFRKLGGNVGVAGMVINKDDGTGEAQAFAEAVGIPVLAAIPANEDIRRKSANYEIIGTPGGAGAPLFEELAANVAEAPPVRPKPLTQDGLLGLFTGDVSRPRRRARAGDAVQTCAAARDVDKPSLEVVYDDGLRRRRSATAPSASTSRRTTPRSARRRRGAVRRQALGGDGLGCHAGKDEMRRPPPAAARARRSSVRRGLSARARTTSRRACARPSARCASACACAARRRSCRARPAASMA